MNGVADAGRLKRALALGACFCARRAHRAIRIHSASFGRSRYDERPISDDLRNPLWVAAYDPLLGARSAPAIAMSVAMRRCTGTWAILGGWKEWCTGGEKIPTLHDEAKVTKPR